MKTFKIAGFAGYAIAQDGQVIDLSTNKAIKIAKNGTVKMVASDTVEGFTEAGKTYTYNVEKDLMPIGQDPETTWEDSAAEGEGEGEGAKEGEGTDGAQATPAETPEAKAAREKKEAFIAKTKELREKATKARDYLLTVDLNDTAKLIEAKGAFDSAQAEYDTHIKSNEPQVTPEQKAAQDAYDHAAEDYNGILEVSKQYRETLDKAAEALKAAGGKPGKVKGQATGVSNPDKAAKFAYEDAQNVRQMYSLGRYGNANPEGRDKPFSIAEIAEKMSCSNAAVGYMVNYLQHKLKKGDTAFTPLINEYYPAIDSQYNETGTNGAPYVEDKVAENPNKYVKASNRTKPSVNKPDATATPPVTPPAVEGEGTNANAEATAA